MDHRGNYPSWCDGSCSPGSWIASPSLAFIRRCFSGSFRRFCVGRWACRWIFRRLGTWFLGGFRGFGGFIRSVFGLGRFGCFWALLASSRSRFDVASVASFCLSRFAWDGPGERFLGASEVLPFSSWFARLFHRFCQFSLSLKVYSLSSSIFQPNCTISASPNFSPSLSNPKSASMA